MANSKPGTKRAKRDSGRRMADEKTFVVKYVGDQPKEAGPGEFLHSPSATWIALPEVIHGQELEITVREIKSKRQRKIDALRELLGDERDGRILYDGETETLDFYVEALEAIDREDP